MMISGGVQVRPAAAPSSRSACMSAAPRDPRTTRIEASAEASSGAWAVRLRRRLMALINSQAGRPKVIRRSAGRARDYLLRLLGEGPDDPSFTGDPSFPAVGAALLIREPVSPRRNSHSRAALITPRPLQGEGLDGAVEPVAGGASDHGAFERPVARAHSETARHLGRKAASFGAVVVQVGRAVKEHHLSLQNRSQAHRCCRSAGTCL
jgi:hypothetical protein